jgi:hypothetical protein
LRDEIRDSSLSGKLCVWKTCGAIVISLPSFTQKTVTAG